VYKEGEYQSVLDNECTSGVCGGGATERQYNNNNVYIRMALTDSAIVRTAAVDVGFIVSWCPSNNNNNEKVLLAYYTVQLIEVHYDYIVPIL